MPEKTYSSSPSRPVLALPPGACDTHVHVFGPSAQFPFAAESTFKPADAGKDTLFALHRHLGIERCVIVQSACHGFDNSAVEDAIAAGKGRYLGVALAPVDVTQQELERLASAGFRAIRFNFMRHLAGAAIEDVVAMTPRLAAAGLHLQVHFESSLVHSLSKALAHSAVPVVIDHMGRVNAQLGPEHEDFLALQEALARNKNFYVKVSGIDRIDSILPYTQGKRLARQLVVRFPEQCLWGTDWPHPNHTHIPDDGQLVDALADIAPSALLRQTLLVDNPQSLYQFPAPVGRKI